jgi:hypothetical protein
LKRQTADPPDRLTTSITARYGDALQRQLARRNIKSSTIVRAEVQVDFHVPENGLASLPTYGEPTRCSVVLADDRGREYRRSVVTACAPHDPKRESKSARANA